MAQPLDDNKDNDDDIDIIIKPTNTSSPKIPQNTKSPSYHFKKFIKEKSNDSEEDIHNLLQIALSTISKSYQEGISSIDKQLKIQKQRSEPTINEIDRQIFALSQQKKELKIEMAQFNKDANNKIDLLLSHQSFINRLLNKYEESIKNGFLISDKSYTNDDNNDYVCNHCGYSAMNEHDLNSHLIINNHEKSFILSSSEWKYCLIKIIGHYSNHLQEYQNQVLHQMLQSKEPLLKPSKPVNPQKIYHIPHYDVLQNYNHNKNVLQNYHKSTTTYPPTMTSQEVMRKFVKHEQKIDYRDYEGRYLIAKIKAIDYDNKRKSTKVGITYLEWENKWNVWSIINIQNERFAEYRSISKRKSINRKCMKYIKITTQGPWGEPLEVRPIHLYNDAKNKNMPNPDQYLQWYPAKVILNDWHPDEKTKKIKIQSAQVKCVLYKYCEQNDRWILPPYCKEKQKWLGHVYWVHLDNDKECQPMNTNLSNVDY